MAGLIAEHKGAGCPHSVEEVLPVERVSLGGTEAGVADDAAKLLFGGAVGNAGARGWAWLMESNARSSTDLHGTVITSGALVPVGQSTQPVQNSCQAPLDANFP